MLTLKTPLNGIKLIDRDFAVSLVLEAKLKTQTV